MSGNPFRVSQSFKQAAGAPAPHLNTADDIRSAEDTVRRLDNENASPPPTEKTKKSVRIVSPASSRPHPADHDNPLLQQLKQEQHATNLSSGLPADFSDSFADSTPTNIFGGGRADDAYDSPGVIGSARKETDMIGAVQSPLGAPLNPFARTLASIEPQEKGSPALGKAAGQGQEREPAEKTTPGTPRNNMDVESFKRMLMTGITSPPSPGQAPPSVPSVNPAPVSAFESSSGTDTSSISRQSIFEPVQEALAETPRTSYEMAASDDEMVGLVTDVRKMEKKKKPPPAPKHRHGKLVTSRAPQTVSFSEFSATQSTASPLTQNSTSADLNKPLPPPPIISPAAHTDSQDSFQAEDASTSVTRLTEVPGPAEASLAQKRIPPPVPLSRRQSQLRTSVIGNRSRSNSSITNSPQQSATDIPLSGSTGALGSTSPSSQKAPPPPPPTRRAGNPLTGGNGSSAASSTTELPSTISIRRSGTSPPDPPSSRKSMILSSSPIPAEPGLSRAASTRSTRTNSRNVSNESTNLPPPPPPPRRTQPGRTSMDKERPHYSHASPTGSRRTSSEHKRNSFDINRRTSVASESSLKHEYAPAAENEHPLYSPQEDIEEPRVLESMPVTQSDSLNILDDMEKFQREIDQLRERYQTGS